VFGLDRAKKAISSADRAVVVEGYFDTIALHAAGIENAVASLGTALSLTQVKQLVKYSESKQIILNFDADRAGNIAAERAIGEIADLAYRGQLQLRILNLPAGKDADEYLNSNSADDYLQLLDRSPLWLDWQIDNELRDRDLTQAEQYQQAVNYITQLLAKISDPTIRTHYLQKVSGLLSAGDTRMAPLIAENLQTGLRRIERAQFDRDRRRSTTPNPSPEIEYDPTPELVTEIIPATIVVHPSQRLLEQAEGLLLRIYLHFPDRRLEIIDALDSADLNFTLSHYDWLWQQIMASYQSGEIDYLDDRTIEKLRDRSADAAEEIDRVSHLFYLDERTGQEILRSPLVIRAAIACLEKIVCERQKKYYLDKWQTSTKNSPDLQQEYYQLFDRYQQRLQELEKQRTFTIADLVLLDGSFR
jgi:DNA primase